MLRPSTYDDAVCVNAAVEIDVHDYNVTVRQGTAPGHKAGNRALTSIGFVTQRIESKTKTNLYSALYISSLSLKRPDMARV